MASVGDLLRAVDKLSKRDEDGIAYRDEIGPEIGLDTEETQVHQEHYEDLVQDLARCGLVTFEGDKASWVKITPMGRQRARKSGA